MPVSRKMFEIQVLELLARPDHWPALRSAARSFVETQRNWPGSVERYRGVYASLLPRVAKA